MQGRYPDIWCSNRTPGRSFVPLTRGPRIPWRIPCGPLWAPGNSAGQEARGSSEAEGAFVRVRPGQCASLCTAVSGSVRLDWGQRRVPLTRGLRIPWGILCGPLRVPGNSAGQEARGSSGAEGRLSGFMWSSLIHLDLTLVQGDRNGSIPILLNDNSQLC